MQTQLHLQKQSCWRQYRHVVDSKDSCVQIQTTVQKAVAVGLAYPSIPGKHQFLEVLALEQRQPSMEVLLQQGRDDPIQHATKWLRIAKYLQGINTNTRDVHVSLQNVDVKSAKDITARRTAASLSELLQ